MSIGWGIRGQFGGEVGASIAGALGGMAVVLASGREDWYRRVAFFGMFGAIGWAYGGGMSYMKVIAYGHSPDSPTVLYGFAATFFLGFLWAAPGGAGTALAAYLTREQLTEMFVTIAALFGVWFVEGILTDLNRAFFSGMWWSIGVPIVTVVVVAAVRRRLDIAGELVLYIYAGRGIGYFLLADVFALRLSPPRGEGWAAMVGLIAGLLVFCWRRRLWGVAFATVATGFLGGIGFALGEMLKIINISTGLHTNWHSVMEQTQGLLHGVALAVAMLFIIRSAPRLSDEPALRKWPDVLAVMFVLWLIPYLNARQSPADWVQQIDGVTEQMYGIWIEAGFRFSRGFIGWFDMAWLAIAVVLIWLLVIHLKRGLPLVPSTWLGRGQLLFVGLLWAMTAINFMHVLGRFDQIRLVTEFAITINAAICTVLMAVQRPVTGPVEAAEPRYGMWMRNFAVAGVAGAIVVTLAGWTVKRALFGDNLVPGSVAHIRFGPHNTNDKK